jgi:hypothetical protein
VCIDYKYDSSTPGDFQPLVSPTQEENSSLIASSKDFEEKPKPDSEK